MTTEPRADSRDEPAPRSMGRIRDRTSLVVGVVAIALAAIFALGDFDSVHQQVRIIWPVTLVGVGTGLLLGAGRRTR